MSDFVEQCRREWKRLRVADPIAEEMAADLIADLREAEAEGVSAEELLGSSVFDPRSFAASWANERGIIPVEPRRETASRKPLALLALATLSAIALIVGALALLTSRSNVAVVPWRTARPHLPSPPPASGLSPLAVHAGGVAATAVAWILILLATAVLVLAGWLWSTRVRSRPPTASA